jgi:hypothetical protein
MMDVYDRRPVNKMTAIVANQQGCASDDTLTEEQERENLVAILKGLEFQIQRTAKGPFRKGLGRQKADLQERIHAIRPKVKSPGIENFFIAAAKEKLSGPQFKMVMRSAGEKMDAAAKMGLPPWLA